MSTALPQLERLRAAIARFAGRRIAVLGDCMLDRYLWGRVERISPEAPVPVVEIERESFTLGGAGNVAANLRALGAEPLLLGAVGEDDDGRRLRAAFAERGLDTRGVIGDPARPTTVKTRIVAHSQQVVRADRESRADLGGAALERLLRVVEDELPGCEGLVVSDYGKGVIHAGTLAVALGLARARGFAVSVDPKESHIETYRGVSILTPNQHEAGWAQGRRITDEASLLEVGWGLQQRLDAAAVLVTRGPDGMSLFERGGRYTHLPTVAREVYDVTGAGDTVVSVVALALAAGADFPDSCRLANHAAGIVIREVGTATCTREELLASLADTRP
ncbi:MAG: D-glycero-beta-D-manno-heptose-7-phosphate kinase [Candidatus Eisenbacteria bacterium]|nr:D-glycero-beta-D-manno-heptose-7-phosphate kinase [Candidatus Eisenbacteria bacterium]